MCWWCTLCAQILQCFHQTCSEKSVPIHGSPSFLLSVDFVWRLTRSPSPNRLCGAFAGNGFNEWGTSGFTSSPFTSQLPRSKTWEARCISDGLSIITGVVGTSALYNSLVFLFYFCISWFVFTREFFCKIKPVEQCTIVFGFFQIGIGVSKIQIMYSIHNGNFDLADYPFVFCLHQWRRRQSPCRQEYPYEFSRYRQEYKPE